MSNLFVNLEVMRCKDCGRLVFAANSKDGGTGVRLSNHKCSGRWETVHMEKIALSDIENEAFEDTYP